MSVLLVCGHSVEYDTLCDVYPDLAEASIMADLPLPKKITKNWSITGYSRYDNDDANEGEYFLEYLPAGERLESPFTADELREYLQHVDEELSSLNETAEKLGVNVSDKIMVHTIYVEE